MLRCQSQYTLQEDDTGHKGIINNYFESDDETFYHYL
jgi:hypothetical protein